MRRSWSSSPRRSAASSGAMPSRMRAASSLDFDFRNSTWCSASSSSKMSAVNAGSLSTASMISWPSPCESEVGRLRDATLGHVNQMASEHVCRQQHLTGAALECLGPDRVRIEPHAAWLERVDQVPADEHVLRADANLEALDRRVRTVAELDDEVLDPPDLGPRRVEDRAAQELRDHQPALVLVVPRLIHAPVLILFTHC